MKVLTLDCLKRRRWSLANRCFHCLEEEGTIGHILIHCVKTIVLWNLVFSFFGVLWTLPSSIRDALLGWHGSFVGQRRKKVWWAAPWMERNRRAFENEEQSVQGLELAFLCNL